MLSLSGSSSTLLFSSIITCWLFRFKNAGVSSKRSFSALLRDSGSAFEGVSHMRRFEGVRNDAGLRRFNVVGDDLWYLPSIVNFWLVREGLDGVAKEFEAMIPSELRAFLDGVSMVLLGAGERRSKRPRKKPSFCGVGPIDLRWVGVWCIERGESYGSSKEG